MLGQKHNAFGVATKAAVHPLAAIFPMMSEGELQDLADDIKEHGLRQPIVIDADGVLIDGRNRLKACKMAEVEPTFVRLDGEDPAAYILSANVERRSPTAAQKAMARALANPETTDKGGRPRRGETVKRLNGSERVMLSQARLILRALGEPIALKVLTGVKHFDEALREATAACDRQASDEAFMTRLRDTAPDLADLVTEGRMTLGEALAAHEERLKRLHEAIEDGKRAAPDGGAAVGLWPIPGPTGGGYGGGAGGGAAG